MEKGVGVIDFINRIVQILKRDLYQVKINTQDMELIKLIKLQNKGQLSYVIIYILNVLMYLYIYVPNIPTY